MLKNLFWRHRELHVLQIFLEHCNEIPSPGGSSAMPCHFTHHLFQAFDSGVSLCSEMHIFKYVQVSVSYIYKHTQGLYTTVPREAVLVCKDPYLWVNDNIYKG